MTANTHRYATWILVAALAAVLLVGGVAVASRFGTDPKLVPSPLIGKPAPAFTLDRLDGQGTVSLDDYPFQILVVNFWASWCVACRAEHPALVATAAAFKDQGVEFLGIVYQDRPESARAFLDELGWGYTYAVDPTSATAIDFGVFGVPETFFLDRGHIVVAKISGQSDALLLGSTLQQILAGERPGARTAGTVQGTPGG